MSDRKENIQKLKTKASLKNLQVITTGEQLYEIIESTVEALQKTISQGVAVNDLDVLLDRLENIGELKASIDDLKIALKDFPAIPEEVKIASINEFLDAVRGIEIKAPDITIQAPEQQHIPDYSKSVIKLAEAVEGMAINIKAAAPKPPSQRAQDFIPYRRVIKDGNSYKFDDSVEHGGGGGVSTPTRKNTDGNVYVPVANPDGTNISGGGVGGGAVTIADGADVTQGAIADASVTAGATGTVSAKLRRISADIDSIKTNTGNIPASPATTAKQDTGNTSLGNIDTSTAAINTVAGAKTDVKSTATDSTSVSMMQVLKQISASVQAPPSQAVTNAGTFAVQAAEADGANVTLGSKADAKSTATDTTAVTIMQVLKQISASVQAPPSQAVTNTGTFATQATLQAGSATIGNVGLAPQTSGGWSTFNATSGDGSTALTNTAQQVKATAGQVGGWFIYNPNAAVAYVNFYNATSASVTVGTTNQQMVIPIPAGQAANVEFTNGLAFSTAISISATTTGGGNTAPSTALDVNVFYK